MIDVDAIIAEASTAPAQTASPEAPTESNLETEVKLEQEATAEPATKEVEEDVSKKPDSELTPEQLAKRERNRQSHQNSKLAQLRRENRELKAKSSQPVEQPKTQNTQPTTSTGEPKSNDPYYKDKDWEEFTRDLVKWKVEQNFTAQNKQTEESKQIEQQASAFKKGGDAISAKETEFAKQAPDYANLINDNQEFFKGMTPELAQGFLDAENPTLALYALMREGKVDDLYDLSPTKLAAELVRAEIRGESYLKQPKVTNAPRPLSPARGNTSGTKDVNDMSVEELMSTYKT